MMPTVSNVREVAFVPLAFASSIFGILLAFALTFLKSLLGVEDQERLDYLALVILMLVAVRHQIRMISIDLRYRPDDLPVNTRVAVAWIVVLVGTIAGGLMSASRFGEYWLALAAIIYSGLSMAFSALIWIHEWRGQKEFLNIKAFNVFVSGVVEMILVIFWTIVLTVFVSSGGQSIAWNEPPHLVWIVALLLVLVFEFTIVFKGDFCRRVDEIRGVLTNGQT